MLKNKDQEVERFHLIPGMCFGEWALLYNVLRTASAYTLEETELFSLDKENFDLYFSKFMIKAENDRKFFMFNKIPLFKKLQKYRFDEYYKKMIPLFFKKNDVIYKESDFNNSFYLIYQGECLLKKNLNNVNNNLSVYEDNNLLNSKTILKLDKGDMAGLEISNNITYFQNSLVANSDYTVIMKIMVEDLVDHKASVFKYLYPFYKEREILVNSYLENHISLKKKFKIRYRTLSADLENENIQDENKEKENLRIDKIKELMKSVQSNKSNRKVTKNQMKFLLMESNLSNSNFNITSNNFISSNNSLIDNNTSNNLNSFRIKSSINDNKLISNNNNNNNKSNSAVKKKNSTTIFKAFKINKKNKVDENNKSKISFYDKVRPLTRASLEEKLQKSNLIRNKLIEKEPNISITINELKSKPERFDLKTRPKSFKDIVKRPVSKIKNLYVYNSGLFNLPLVNLCSNN